MIATTPDSDLLPRWQQLSLVYQTTGSKGKSTQADKITKFLAELQAMGELTILGDTIYRYRDIGDDEPKPTSLGVRNLRIIGYGKREMEGIDATTREHFYIDLQASPAPGYGSNAPFWRYLLSDLRVLRKAAYKPPESL